MAEQTLAEMLHQATSDCSKGTKKILLKCQKAALNGNNFIKVKCSEADYQCLNGYRYNHPPATPLIEELQKHGFHLNAESDYGAFWSTFTLQISW